MKYLIKEVVKNYVSSTAVTLGMFTAVVIWGEGLGDIMKDNCKKMFSKVKNEEGA
jgi:hypothetical protein